MIDVLQDIYHLSMADQNKLVTIALATYNVERYLKEALECIVNQTYRNLEILCIDDCSNDKTFDILQHYRRLDSRIRIVRQAKNSGLAVSRNTAIDLAHGEYIIMLDGDDLFSLQMVEKAYLKIIETGADIVMWDYCSFYNPADLPHLLNKKSDLVQFDHNDKIGLLKRPAFTWVKLIRTDVLRNLGVHFPEGLTKQDIPVWWQLVTSVHKIAILPERLSYYRQNPHNTSSRKDKSVFSLAFVMDITGNYLHTHGLYDDYRDFYLYKRLSLLHGMYDYIIPELKEEAKTMIKERMDEDTQAYLTSPSCSLSKRTRWFYKGYILGNQWAKLQYDAIILVRALYRKFKR